MVFIQDNLAKVNGEAYVINFDDFKSKETHWIACYVNNNNNNNNMIYFHKKLKNSLQSKR